jgi:hypothetical protein
MLRAVLVFACLASFTFATAHGTPHDAPPPWNDLEKRLVAELSDGQLGQMPLLAAALIAGGVTSDDDLQLNLRRFDFLCEQLDRSPFLHAR